jgi:hypothetical protein
MANLPELKLPECKHTPSSLPTVVTVSTVTIECPFCREDRKDALISALAGALLEAEVSEHLVLCIDWDPDSLENRCGVCDRSLLPRSPHKPDCSLDAALTLAGFPDQASRDAERQRREKEGR